MTHAVILMLGLLWLSPQTPARKPVHHATRHSASKAKAKAKPKPKPAPGIAPARAVEIEQALVGAGYLDHADDHWDAAAVAAMKKYQKDHHWQVKFVPDARALIALGLGTPTQSPGRP